jgi:hypothetical protein
MPTLEPVEDEEDARTDLAARGGSAARHSRRCRYRRGRVAAGRLLVVVAAAAAAHLVEQLQLLVLLRKNAAFSSGVDACGSSSSSASEPAPPGPAPGTRGLRRGSWAAALWMGAGERVREERGSRVCGFVFPVPLIGCPTKTKGLKFWWRALQLAHHPWPPLWVRPTVGQRSYGGFPWDGCG